MGRVLLTGGTGFVGRAITRALKEREILVRHVIRTGTAMRVDPCKAPDDEIVETPDLFAQSKDWWAQTCAGADLVLHAAWYAEPGKYLTSGRNFDCLCGTVALARGAAEAGVQRFVGIGTCFEYDLSPGYVSTGTPLDPQTPYAAAKAAAYQCLKTWLPLQDVSFLWGRLFFLYGADEDERRLVPYLHRQLSAGEPADLTSGTQLRDFLDVDKAAAMLVKEAQSGRTGAVNICSGKGITVRALAERIADQYGRRDLLNFGARPHNITDPPCVVGIRADET